MSVSSLPEWKQLLLERKRREEEEREKREKEEEDKLASMPAWKRGIIQRRRMKQSFGDKEREGPLQVKEEAKPQSLVLLETIIPVGQNSFIRTHGGWRRGREAERRGLDKARIKGREGVGGREAEPQVRERRESYFRRGSEVRDMKRVSEVRDMKSVSEVRDMKRVSEVRDCTISVETTQQNCVITLSIDRASPPQSVDSHYNHVSAFTECSSTLLSTVAHKGTDWHSSQGAPGHHSIQSPLSQHTEDLINKIERVGGTVNERDNHKGTQTLMQDGKGVMREDTETERGSKAYTEPGEVSKDTIHSPGAHHPRQKDQQTILNPRKSQSNLQLHSERPPQPKQAQSNQPKQVRSITINSRSVLTPSPENSLHPDQGVPTTPSASPSQSPSVSPSPSPSPTHFTIRSLSGGQQVKRGTTITITPRKPLANTSAQSQMPVLTEEGERGKKKYPTAEEIEVIGGYQNLDKSCLVKTSKASPKGVSVDCRLAYCRLCTINCIDEVSHLVVMIMGSHHLRLCLMKTQLVKQNENSRKWLE
uniref:Phostensin n=1 Tax=Oncorhynchus kisutch TaxID=8019 RepID=A0A8C7HAH9_ONCKI